MNNKLYYLGSVLLSEVNINTIPKPDNEAIQQLINAVVAIISSILVKWLIDKKKK